MAASQQWAERAFRVVAMMVGVLWLGVGLSGCDTGTRGLKGEVEEEDPIVPLLQSITPTEGYPGDVVTLSGYEFNLDPALNRVTFVATDGSGVQLVAPVLEVVESGIDDKGRQTTARVVVPTGARSSNVSLQVQTDEGDFLSAQSPRFFTVGPIVLGVVIGNDGLSGQVSFNAAGVPLEASIAVVGYNLNTITSATFVDEVNSPLAAVSVSAGMPANATWTLPVGMQVATIGVPNVTAFECSEFTDSYTLQVTAAAGTGTPLLSNSVAVHFTASTLGSASPVITAATVPSGVRTGSIGLTYELAMEPSSEEWRVVPQYYDPVVAAFLECTPLDIDAGERVLSGSFQHTSVSDRHVGPGHLHTFVWDAAADLPGMSGATRLRIEPEARAGSTVVCSPSVWVTERIAFDNTRPTAGAIVENFDTRAALDAAATTAAWGNGSLTGVGTATTTPPVYGSGIDDVVLENNPDFQYEIATDYGFLTRISLSGSLPPMEMMPSNVGANLDPAEFHCRTFVWEEGANVVLVGDNALRIRCVGDGTSSAPAFVFEGVVDVSGSDGSEGTTTDHGLGGVGILGGGNGGDGGRVDTNSLLQEIESVVPAQAGGNCGGAPGESTSFAKEVGPSSPRAGAGGGGGHAVHGEPGRGITSAIHASFGRGGQPRGNMAMTVVTAGSGGGGGGAAAFRQNLTNPELRERHGGGGGAGGGAVEVTANGSIEFNGVWIADGGEGARATQGVNGGGGGGGSGGGVALRATGSIEFGSQAVISCRGGEGGGTSSFGGGAGADGRIRIEANGTVNYAGAVDLSGVTPAVGALSSTTGVAVEAD